MWKFRSVLKETIWGGDRIKPLKGLDCEASKIGESWEISAIPGSESVVSDGLDYGLKLSELVEKYGADLLGERVYKRVGNSFPLLVKFIDAHDNLSVQVHPDNNMADRLGMANGKTEMWYVMDAYPGSHISIGFKEKVRPEEYENLVKSGEIENLLRRLPVKKGDVFFIPGGRVHSIGSGILLAEIQQSSDVTYRIYDYHRKDYRGEERELHTELARKAIDFDDIEGGSLEYVVREDIPITLVKCPDFTTNLLKVDTQLMRDYSELDSFVTLTAVNGKAELRCNSMFEGGEKPTSATVTLQAGESVLISAKALGLEIIPQGKFKALESWV